MKTKALYFIFILLLSGCALTQYLYVKSDPPGAKVIVNNKQVGTTPAYIQVSKKEKTVDIKLEKDEYEPATVKLTRHFNVWYFPGTLLACTLAASSRIITEGITKGSLISAGVGTGVGFGVGMIGGIAFRGAYKFKPKKINASLVRSQDARVNNVGNPSEDRPVITPVD